MSRNTEARRAARGDFDAADRYERLAGTAETPKHARELLARARESRRSAIQNLRSIGRRGAEPQLRAELLAFEAVDAADVDRVILLDGRPVVLSGS